MIPYHPKGASGMRQIGCRPIRSVPQAANNAALATSQRQAPSTQRDGNREKAQSVESAHLGWNLNIFWGPVILCFPDYEMGEAFSWAFSKVYQDPAATALKYSRSSAPNLLPSGSLKKGLGASRGHAQFQTLHPCLALPPTWRPAKEHHPGGTEVAHPCYLAQA